MRSVLTLMLFCVSATAFAEVTSSVASPEHINSPEPDIAPMAAVQEGDVTAEVVPAAANASPDGKIPSLFQARIEQHTADEMLALLQRAERIAAGQDEYRTRDPVVLVLNGDEIELFKRENYRTNKPLIDLAARLDAFNIIDVKVCKNWTAQRGIELTDLPPFIEGVSSGSQENKRLEQAGYAYF